MAFEKFNWENRISQYPNRRIITNVENNVEEVVEITRDEGTILNNGTSFSAENMNNLEERISDMFPVSVANGGTGATNQAEALTNLGIPISGEWTPFLESFGDSTNISPTYTGTNRGVYRKIGDLVFIVITINITITNTPAGYARISGLPFNANNSYFYSFSVSQSYNLLEENNVGVRISSEDKISLSKSLSGYTNKWIRSNEGGSLLISGFYLSN